LNRSLYIIVGAGQKKPFAIFVGVGFDQVLPKSYDTTW